MTAVRGNVRTLRTDAEPEPLTLPSRSTLIPVTSRDGTGLHVEVFGQDNAPTVVLAHGITMQTRFWAYQVRDLADRFRVVVYDQRGHGLSDRVPAQRCTIDALGDDLQAVLEDCVPPGERAVIAGHSLGGITIMSWAGRYPHEVQQRAAAAVLVNTAACEIVEHVGLIGIPRKAHGIAKSLVRRRLVSIARSGARLPLRIIAMGDVAHPTHVDALMAMTKAVPAETLNNFIVALTDMDLTASLSSLTAPTLIIGGSRDRLLPPVHCHRLRRDLPNVLDYVMLAGSGHMSPWEERAAVSLVIGDVTERMLPRRAAGRTRRASSASPSAGAARRP